MILRIISPNKYCSTIYNEGEEGGTSANRCRFFEYFSKYLCFIRSTINDYLWRQFIINSVSSTVCRAEKRRSVYAVKKLSHFSFNCMVSSSWICTVDYFISNPIHWKPNFVLELRPNLFSETFANSSTVCLANVHSALVWVMETLNTSGKRINCSLFVCVV